MDHANKKMENRPELFCNQIRRTVPGMINNHLLAQKYKQPQFAKSLLCLAKVFQGRSYDLLVAHTSIVFTRYIIWRCKADMIRMLNRAMTCSTTVAKRLMMLL